MYKKERKELLDFCRGMNCYDCPVKKNNPDHRCGNGTTFNAMVNGSYVMDDNEIIRAYKWVFGIDLTEKVTPNPVSHPSHYTQGGIECIDAMEAAFGKEAVSHFCICNAFKYIFRHEHKNGKEDIEKAEWYLNKYKGLKYSE